MGKGGGCRDQQHKHRVIGKLVIELRVPTQCFLCLPDSYVDIGTPSLELHPSDLSVG